MKALAIALMWLNDRLFTRIVMWRIGPWWVPAWPWRQFSRWTCALHHRVLPERWVLVEGETATFWARPG